MQHPVLREFVRYEKLLQFLEKQKNKNDIIYPTHELVKNTYVNRKNDIMLHVRWAIDISRRTTCELDVNSIKTSNLHVALCELDVLIDTGASYIKYIVHIAGKPEIVVKDQQEVDDIITDYFKQMHFSTCYAIHIPDSVYDIMKQTGIKFYQNVGHNSTATIGNKKSLISYSFNDGSEFRVINDVHIIYISYQNKKVTKLIIGKGTAQTDLTNLYDEQKINEMANIILINDINRYIIETILPPKLHPILDKLSIIQHRNLTNHEKVILYDGSGVTIIFKSGLTSLEYCFPKYKEGDWKYEMSKILKMDAFGHMEAWNIWTSEQDINTQCEEILKLVNHE